MSARPPGVAGTVPGQPPVRPTNRTTLGRRTGSTRPEPAGKSHGPRDHRTGSTPWLVGHGHTLLAHDPSRQIAWSSGQGPYPSGTCLMSTHRIVANGARDELVSAEPLADHAAATRCRTQRCGTGGPVAGPATFGAPILP